MAPASYRREMSERVQGYRRQLRAAAPPQTRDDLLLPDGVRARVEDGLRVLQSTSDSIARWVRRESCDVPDGQ